MLKKSPLPEITPSLKSTVRGAILACLLGTVGAGCTVRAAGYIAYPQPVYVPTPGGMVPCVPPVPTVYTVGRRPYYFAQPLGPTTVVVAPSHPYYLCP